MTSQNDERLWRGTLLVLGCVAGSIFYQLCKAAVVSRAVDPANLFEGFPTGFSLVMALFLAREPSFRPKWPPWGKYLLLFAVWLAPFLLGLAFLTASALTHGNWGRYKQDSAFLHACMYLVIGFSFWLRVTFPKLFKR